MQFLVYFSILFYILQFTKSFNLDTEYTILKNGEANSFFGFSVSTHIDGTKSWLLVGAPKSNSTYISDPLPGAVYKCDPLNVTRACKDEILFDGTNAKPDEETKTGQWMGVSLKSGGKDRPIITCGHRYTYHGKLNDFRLFEGRCWTVESNFVQGVKISVCSNKDNPGYDKLIGQCESGIGLEQFPKDPDGETNYVIGGVGVAYRKAEFADPKDYELFTGRVYERNGDTEGVVEGEVKSISKPLLGDSYFGYAITVGYFFSKTNRAVAAGGPRHQSVGKVLIYPVGLGGIIQQLPSKSDEVQLASGYGIAVVAIDSNQDGFQELVVGAPFYSTGIKHSNQGIVYVYKKEGKELVLHTKLKGGILKGKGVGVNSYFGYALIDAGDINLDGYNDLVVGAPFENEMRGAIYIYMGGANGLSETFVQHIEALSIVSGLTDNIGLKGFGRSLAGGLDLDENGYNDILVGAFASNQAVLLRSRPVISVYTNVTFIPEELQLLRNCTNENVVNSTCFEMRFCYRFTEASGKVYTNPGDSLPIRFKIQADPIGKRVRFNNTKKDLEFTVNATKEQQCIDIEQLYLVLNDAGTVSVYPDIKFYVDQYLPYGDKDFKKPTKSNTTVINLDSYPFLRDSDNGQGGGGQELDFQLKFKRNCEECIPDLALDVKQNFTIRLGRKSMRFPIVLKNNGTDPAYSVSLKLELPDDLQLLRVHIENKQRYCTNNTCDNLYYVFKKDKKAEIEIELDTEKFSENSEKHMKISVSSLNKEKSDTLSDNEADITFEVRIDADIQVLGGTSTQQVLYSGEVKGESAMTSLDDIGSYVEHRYIVQNNGPDRLPKAILMIEWPYEVKSGKHLLYLVKIDHSQATKCTTAAKLNELNLRGSSRSSSGSLAGLSTPGASQSSKASNQGKKVRKRREVTNSTKSGGGIVDSRKKLGRILNCSTAECISIECEINKFEPGATEVISVRSRLWQPTLLLDYYGDVVTIQSEAVVSIGIKAPFITDPDRDNNENKIYTVVTPVFPPKAGEKIAVWIIALAVVAGVILLVLLIFGLYKLGFFKRQKADEKFRRESDRKNLIGRR